MKSIVAKMKPSLNGRLPVLVTIVLAGIVVYSNTLRVPFILDDIGWIVDNSLVHDLDNFWVRSTAYAKMPNRWLGYLTLALNYHFGGLDVLGYHLVNLSIHLGNGLLVYGLLRLTLRTPLFRSRNFGGDGPAAEFIPLLAALLFVVHPVQTQAVTYVIQRLTSLATLFYLLAVVLYIRARLVIEEPASNPRRGESGGVVGKPAILLIAGSVVSTLLAMKTKEISATLPVAIVLCEACFFSGPWRRRIFYLLPLVATLPVIFVNFLPSGETTGSLLASLDDQLRARSTLSRLDYLFTQFRVISTYLRLLVLPVNQNFDYDYPVYNAFFTPPVFCSFLLLAALLAGAVWLWRKSVPGASGSKAGPFDPATRLISFGIFWFFLTLSVESSIVPIADVIFEHRLYLPNVGAFAAFAAAAWLIFDKLSWPVIGRQLFAVVLVAGLGYVAYSRNGVWQSDVTLWYDVVSKSPDKARARNELGRVLTKAGRPREGIPHLQTAIRLSPERLNVYINLSWALMEDGRFWDTIVFLEQNMGRLNNFPQAHLNLGAAYYYTGNLELARRELMILRQFGDIGFASRLAALLGESP